MHELRHRAPQRSSNAARCQLSAEHAWGAVGCGSGQSSLVRFVAARRLPRCAIRLWSATFWGIGGRGVTDDERRVVRQRRGGRRAFPWHSSYRSRRPAEPTTRRLPRQRAPTCSMPGRQRGAVGAGAAAPPSATAHPAPARCEHGALAGDGDLHRQRGRTRGRRDGRGTWGAAQMSDNCGQGACAVIGHPAARALHTMVCDS